MRTIIWFIYFWVSLVALIPDMFRAKKLTEQQKMPERTTLVHAKVYQWMSALLRLAGVTVEVSGLEHIPNRTVVFVSNHQGNFDIPILLCHLDQPHGIVAKKELQKLPFIRVWMQYLGCVFLDRNNPRHSAAAINQAVQQVKDGQSMIIFPEGTRSQADLVGSFKQGAFKLAYKTGTDIVPICIDGSYKAMEANHMWIKPAHVRVRILPPVSIQSFSKDQFPEIGAHVRSLIIEAKSKI